MDVEGIPVNFPSGPDMISGKETGLGRDLVIKSHLPPPC